MTLSDLECQYCKPFQIRFFVSCSSWLDFNWRRVSRGLSAIAGASWTELMFWIAGYRRNGAWKTFGGRASPDSVQHCILHVMDTLALQETHCFLRQTLWSVVRIHFISPIHGSGNTHTHTHTYTHVVKSVYVLSLVYVWCTFSIFVVRCWDVKMFDVFNVMFLQVFCVFILPAFYFFQFHFFVFIYFIFNIFIYILFHVIFKNVVKVASICLKFNQMRIRKKQ